MPIVQLVTNVAAILNRLFPTEHWQTDINTNNLQPWARIFSTQMLENWPANQGHNFPLSWFEIKCVNKRPHHNGNGPFSVYLLLDDRQRIQRTDLLDRLVNRILPLPRNDNGWQHQLIDGIHQYQLDQRRAELDPRLVFDERYLDAVIGYIILRKELFE